MQRYLDHPFIIIITLCKASNSSNSSNSSKIAHDSPMIRPDCRVHKVHGDRPTRNPALLHDASAARECDLQSASYRIFRPRS